MGRSSWWSAAPVAAIREGLTLKKAGAEQNIQDARETDEDVELGVRDLVTIGLKARPGGGRGGGHPGGYADRRRWW